MERHSPSQKESLLRRFPLILLSVLAILGGACGSDDAVSTTAADDDMAMADVMFMDDTEDEGHTHDHGAEMPTTEWPSEFDEPVVTIDATADATGTLDITVDVTGFVIISAGQDGHAANEGHVHVLVDGRDLGMFFSADITLEGVDPGPHELSVELAAADHSTLTLDGAAMRYSTEIVVPGDVVEADAVIEVHVGEDGAHGGVVEAKASIGDVVEIQIMSEIDDDLHVHGYDRYVELVSGETATLSFDALIPGVFEIELEGSGRQVIELTVS
jgi:hypothetical protein